MMNDPAETARREQRFKDAADKRFQEWLAEPMTRMGLSMIPAGEKEDALRLLLRAAFDAGRGMGQGAVMVEMLEALILRDKRREP